MTLDMGKIWEFFKAGISCLTTTPKSFWERRGDKTQALNQDGSKKEVSISMRHKRVRYLN